MMQAPARRGRPKGTGIDDSDRIARLAELLRIHPELKPTTAIRVMGFTDPSAIRRLRDKYKVFTQDSTGVTTGTYSAPAGTPIRTLEAGPVPSLGPALRS